jgi:hypothetical protein
LNLITQFLEVRRSQLSETNAGVIRILNKELRSKHQQGRVKEWETGRRRPGVEVHNYMLKTVLSSEGARMGLTDNNIKSLFNSCRLPDKEREK